MREYTLNIFNKAGAIRAVARIAYDDDQAAIFATEEHSQNHRMELWEGDRLVKRFETGDPPG